VRERVFVDSSAYYAYTDTDDANHAAALSLARRLAADQADFYTSNFVVAETHGLLVNRLDRDAAERVLERLYASTTRIVRATQADETRAREIIRQYTDKNYSLIDAISFAVMQRLHLRQVWTYVHHFAQFGFTAVA